MTTKLPISDLLVYDAKQLALRLGCSKEHVYQLYYRNALPPVCRVGRLVRWSKVAIDDWIANGGSERGRNRPCA